MESGNMTDIEAVALFLQFVPLEGELLDFFHPLTAQVMSLLRGMPCLPTDPLHLHSAEPSSFFTSLVTPASFLYKAEEQVIWKRPSQVLYVRDDFIREHISQVRSRWQGKSWLLCNKNVPTKLAILFRVPTYTLPFVIDMELHSSPADQFN